MGKTADTLRSAAIWMAALPVFLAACLGIVIGTFVFRGRALEALIKGGCRAVLAAAGVRLRVRGRENIVPGRQYVVMMNHVSFFDPLVYQVSFPPPLRGAEEESHFGWPVYGAVLRRLGMFPLSRRDTARAVGTLRRAAAWIRERPGFSFGIMPEGTRTRDGRLSPFKRGGFLTAIEAGVDILPIVERGAFEIARKGSLIVRPGTIDVTVEPAVPTAGYTKETADELIARVRRVFLDRLGE
ncbi:MAG TPA: lysophospholipid acyltransferase family protein [Candidatus Aminicenantes bacterium]|nr:lysophospholipid acyltransferase family protein [Candidatus Aminicenantes bacterium]HRY64847.1 lysophospholipid acyltransferase family protein [Candidatus Aminicenantes bacterium]HRZ71760.1 lysophospholipid acyltransferase family protein [Candidatus Aminicenantes bacterium]